MLDLVACRRNELLTLFQVFYYHRFNSVCANASQPLFLDDVGLSGSSGPEDADCSDRAEDDLDLRGDFGSAWVQQLMRDEHELLSVATSAVKSEFDGTANQQQSAKRPHQEALQGDVSVEGQRLNTSSSSLLEDLHGHADEVEDGDGDTGESDDDDEADHDQGISSPPRLTISSLLKVPVSPIAPHPTGAGPPHPRKRKIVEPAQVKPMDAGCKGKALDAPESVKALEIPRAKATRTVFFEPEPLRELPGESDQKSDANVVLSQVGGPLCDLLYFLWRCKPLESVFPHE